jgi:hypothetical protein
MWLPSVPGVFACCSSCMSETAKRSVPPLRIAIAYLTWWADPSKAGAVQLEEAAAHLDEAGQEHAAWCLAAMLTMGVSAGDELRWLAAAIAEWA